MGVRSFALVLLIALAVSGTESQPEGSSQILAQQSTEKHVVQHRRAEPKLHRVNLNKKQPSQAAQIEHVNLLAQHQAVLLQKNSYAHVLLGADSLQSTLVELDRAQAPHLQQTVITYADSSK